MSLLSSRIDYIKHREELIPRFWRRLGGEPDCKGKRVLEVGCGLGTLCLYMARSGAAKVVGVDTDEHRIAVARQQLHERSGLPDAENRGDFICCDCRDLADDAIFDIIVSRDTLEHLAEPEEVISDMLRRLTPGGRLYIGAGPLYRSPYGGHRRMHMWMPWGHLILPERFLLYWANRYRSQEEKAGSIMELGLNKISVAECARIFNRRDLITVQWEINHGDNRISRLFKKLSKIGLLREYFAHSIYLVMEKKRDT